MLELGWFILAVMALLAVERLISQYLDLKKNNEKED